jgi:hypothetical protein
MSDFWNVTGCSLIGISDKSAATVFKLEYHATGLHIVQSGTLVFLPLCVQF